MNFSTNLSLISVKSEPKHRSETVTQLLYGESCEILLEDKEWAKIRILFDNYEGWVLKNQLVEQATAPKFVNNEVLTNNINLLLPMGAELSEGTQSEAEDQLKIVDIAHLFLNAPYLWGGKSIMGIDCSGFTQVVYKVCGTKLLRDASQQATQGLTVHFLSEALPGDLAFFDNEEGRITHVGILLNSHEIIHASGRVRIDEIDHHGILNSETKQYSHKLRIIKRVL